MYFLGHLEILMTFFCPVHVQVIKFEKLYCVLYLRTCSQTKYTILVIMLRKADLENGAGGGEISNCYATNSSCFTFLCLS